MSESTQPHPRGRNFDSKEDLALAKAWASCSQRHDEMNATEFWGHVSSAFHQQKDVLTKRSDGSLESRFKNIAKVTQKYVAAERLYRSSIPSGECEEDMLANTMTLYRNSNKVKVKNELRPVPEIKFMEAVRLLQKMPKFSTVSRSEGRNASDKESKTIRDKHERSDENVEVNAETAAATRPIGVKRQKREDLRQKNNASNARHLSSSVLRVAEVLKTNAASKNKALSISMKIKIIKSMELSPEERHARLETIYTMADLLYGDVAPPQRGATGAAVIDGTQVSSASLDLVGEERSEPVE